MHCLGWGCHDPSTIIPQKGGYFGFPLLIIRPKVRIMVCVGAVVVLDKIIPHGGGVLLGSMHYFSINYTFAQVGGKVWVGTIIDFCACKNMCLSCCCKVFARTKTCFYVFLCHCKVGCLLKHVSMPLS